MQHYPNLLYLCLTPNSEICSANFHPLLGDLYHQVVSVSTEFTVHSEKDTPFHPVT